MRDVEERTVGRSGLRVSALGLGTMGWGTPGAVSDHHEARDLYLDDVLAAAHGGVAVPADR